MKRVVIDARESGSSTGRYVNKLVQYLHELKPNYEVVVLTKTPQVNFMKQIAPSFQVQPCDIKEFTLAEQLAFKKQLETLNPDLVHFTMTQQPILYRGQKITTVHDLITARFNNPSKNWLVFKLKQLIYRFVIRRAAHHSARIITPTEYVKNDLANFAHINPAKITVTYESGDKINDPPEKIAELAGKSYLLFVGRPNPHKNLARLIEAMELVKQKHPEVLLVLAGKTDANYEKLRRYAEQKNLTNQVFFTGFVSESQLRWLYENALAYAFPSLAEGFGLPGLEAMNYGLPVVSSNASCLPEVYKDAVLYFDPTNAQDMASKLSRVIENKNLRIELSAKGAALLKTYSWAKMAEQTLRVYNQFLKK